MVAAKPRRTGKRALARKAFRLRVSLLDVEPEIWRRFVVPADIELDELHMVLQLVMGWLDCHLHLFRIGSAVFGAPDPDFEDDTQDETGMQLRRLARVGDEFGYDYDFGDDWRHTVVVEAAVDRDEHEHLVLCLDGARRCPPEDVGGPWGYEEFLADYLNPKSKRRKELVEWIGPKLDPERFDIAGVNANLRRLEAGEELLLPDDDMRWDDAGE